MSEPTVLFEIEDSLARVTLNRPNAANAMNLELMRELQAVAQTCETDDSIRAVLLTGSGSMFSAGGDLAWFGQHRETIDVVLTEATFYLHDAIKRLSMMPKPLVVAINGAAAGAGFSLAMAGDYKVAAESASFTMAYTAAGLSPDGGITHLLPRLIGVTRAKELMLTNRKLSAAEALNWGMINSVVTASDVLPAAQAMALRLAAGPTAAFGTVKSLLDASADSSFAAQLDREAQGIVSNGMRHDGQEGIEAFLGKRNPQFKGR